MRRPYRPRALNLPLSIPAASVVLMLMTVAVVSCSSGGDSEQSIEERQYPVLRQILDSTLSACCGLINDALAAQDTVAKDTVPGLEWPFLIPAGEYTDFFPSANHTWSVRRVEFMGSTKLTTTWTLDRWLDTLVMVADDLRPADSLQHKLDFRHTTTIRDSTVEWTASARVFARRLNTDMASVFFNFNAAFKATARCGNRACENYDVAWGERFIARRQGAFSAADLTGPLAATITESRTGQSVGSPNTLVTWEITGDVATGGVMDFDVTASQGAFSRSDTLTFCH